jgi:apolipoprotein N-acyltransferase
VPGLSALPILVRATAMTLQTVSWIFSFWIPVGALVVIVKTIAARPVDQMRTIAFSAGVALVSAGLAWLVSRTARSLLGGSPLSTVLLGVVLAAGGVALLLTTRDAVDRLQETVRSVWGVIAIAWSLALLVAATRRDRGGELARK